MVIQFVLRIAQGTSIVIYCSVHVNPGVPMVVPVRSISALLLRQRRLPPPLQQPQPAWPPLLLRQRTLQYLFWILIHMSPLHQLSQTQQDATTKILTFQWVKTLKFMRAVRWISKISILFSEETVRENKYRKSSDAHWQESVLYHSIITGVHARMLLTTKFTSALDPVIIRSAVLQLLLQASTQKFKKAHMNIVIRKLLVVTVSLNSYSIHFKTF